MLKLESADYHADSARHIIEKQKVDAQDVKVSTE